MQIQTYSIWTWLMSHHVKTTLCHDNNIQYIVAAFDVTKFHSWNTSWKVRTLSEKYSVFTAFVVAEKLALCLCFQDHYCYPNSDVKCVIWQDTVMKLDCTVWCSGTRLVYAVHQTLPQVSLACETSQRCGGLGMRYCCKWITGSGAC